MTNGLTGLLEDFLVQHILHRNQSEYMRLVLGGPPRKILSGLFDLLTSGNGSKWHAPGVDPLPVFLVTNKPSTSRIGTSRECNWDYALTVRNSFPSFLFLVDPLVWDDRTYSIINATDTIGLPLPAVRRRVPNLPKWSTLYSSILGIAADKLGLQRGAIESSVTQALKDLPSLNPSEQHQLPWDIVERIVSKALTDDSVANNELARECGLPPSVDGGNDFSRSRKTLERLAEFLEEIGITDGIRELQATSRGIGLIAELETMGNQLRKAAVSASAFVRAPSFYYHSALRSGSNWWKALTVEVLDEILAEVGRHAQPDRISVSCTNAINISPPSGEPIVVQRDVKVEARHPNEAFQLLRISRRLGRQNLCSLETPGACQSPFEYEDHSPPSHSTPITYFAEDDGATPASVQVISLAAYEPGGFVTCLNTSARKVTKPKRTRVTGPWQQQLFLRSGGARVIRVLCGPMVKVVRLTNPEQMQIERSVIEGVAELSVVIDEDVEITLHLTDFDGKLVSEFAISITIDQDQRETVLSQFDALVQAHQHIRNTISPARTRDSWLRRAENEILKGGFSTIPILLTPEWAASNPSLNDAGILGEIRPQADPRPRLNPPPAFLKAREEILNWLCSSNVPLPEIDLVENDVKQFAVDYLQAYREWAEKTPQEACWLDVAAILEPEPQRYGSRTFAAYEPIAVLLTPLHPIRFGWHVAAQRLLNSGLDTPCPLAGLLDSHRCLDVIALALERSGGEPTWKSYVSISCQDTMWGLFWNAERLREMQKHKAIQELFRAGVVPRGVQSGFTASQARKTLEELNHVLPTRAILRIGVVSSEQGNTSCTEGLVDWSRLRENRESEGFFGPRTIEVYDSRALSSQPSSEEISSLANDTGHRVRWFSQPETTPIKDLVIIDHLGQASPVGEVHRWKSPTTAGSLIRSRIRLDRNNAELVIESRTSHRIRSEDSLLDELSQAIGQVEELAERQGHCSHIAFGPNKEVLRGELRDTRFLAVSSAEIDPACFARSTPQAGGYLWDYELPHAVGAGEQRSGFFLIARPPDALKRAVRRASLLISHNRIDLDALLFETSRRGIPILKRLAAGGSLARGELGMLLAVRLLQDCFRGSCRRVRLPVCDSTTIRMVLPVDPYASVLDKVRQGLHIGSPTLQKATRPDLIVACVRVDKEEGTRVQLVPLEVKFREGVMTPRDKEVSLGQASNLGDLLHHMLRATPLSELWRICGRGFLSEMIDHGFRVYGDPSVNGKAPEQWIKIHETCLADILGGRVTFDVAQEGRLLVFDESPKSYIDDTDRDGLPETLVVSREDSQELLEDGIQISECVDGIASLFDTYCSHDDAQFSFGLVTADKEQIKSQSDPKRESTEESGESIPRREPSGKSIGVPAETRGQVDNAFSGFIGNRPAVDTLRRAVLKAMLSDPPQLPASYLFTGNPSTGKTELARRVARSLDLPFVSLDGRGLVSRERLFELIDGKLQDEGQQANRIGTQFQRPELLYPPLVVFIDEIHLVKRSVQESLLTALEPKDRSVLLTNRVAKLPNITFLFATTRPSDIDAAFRTRCTEIPLADYSEEEVAEIVGLVHPDWDDSLRHRIARYGRRVPRIALELADELATEALVSEHQDRDLAAHLDEVRRTRQIDENGLSGIDIEYLELLDREDRPMGERNILTMLTNIDKDRFLEEVEPLVVARMKLVRKTGRGREITPLGRRYLIEMRKSGSESN